MQNFLLLSKHRTKTKIREIQQNLLHLLLKIAKNLVGKMLQNYIFFKIITPTVLYADASQILSGLLSEHVGL